MLVLQRNEGEQIIIADDITVTYLHATAQGIRLGINSPPDMEVWRREIYWPRQRKRREQLAALQQVSDALNRSGYTLSDCDRCQQPLVCDESFKENICTDCLEAMERKAAAS